jgi:hypothetical protein
MTGTRDLQDVNPRIRERPHTLGMVVIRVHTVHPDSVRSELLQVGKITGTVGR